MIKVNTEFVPKDHFYFLVSGGVDSIAAAHWLKYVFRRDFSILHFNHNFNPSVNFEMKAAVYRFSEAFNIPFLSYSRDESKFIDDSEAGLRKWRLSVMKSINSSFVTAHHLNDAVENYFNNFTKGCPEYTPIPWKSLNIYHPFLRTRKVDFENYISTNTLEKYVVPDPSNQDNCFNRNWIRNEILPRIDKEHISLESVVLRKFYS